MALLRRLRLFLPILAIGFTAPAVHGQFDITVDVMPTGGGMFHYEYTATNTTAIDMVILSLLIPAEPGAISNLSGPAGFATSFDPGLGYLDFIGDQNLFEPALPAGLFTFDSPYGPGPVGYESLNVNGTFFSGSTTGPVIPEPGSGLLLLAGLTFLARARGAGRRHN